MKKILSVIIIVLAAGIAAKAQDVITTTAGEKIKSKVTEVTPDTVKYKRIDNPNGPVYVISKSDIVSILYENGSEEKYNEPAPVTFNEPEPPAPKEEPRYYEPRYTEPRYSNLGDVRYKDIANYYNPNYYESRSGDPYIPVLAGMASFFLPGLGQCMDDEWGRGLGIFAANIGLGLLEVAEWSALFYGGAWSSYDYMYGGMNSWDIMGVSSMSLLATYAVHLGLNIWNICDAVRIAKVKDMYYWDQRGRRYGLDMHFSPNLALVPSAGNNLQPVAGMSLKVNF